MKNKPMIFYPTDANKIKLEEAKKERGMSMSAILNDLISKYLKRR